MYMADCENCRFGVFGETREPYCRLLAKGAGMPMAGFQEGDIPCRSWYDKNAPAPANKYNLPPCGKCGCVDVELKVWWEDYGMAQNLYAEVHCPICGVIFRDPTHRGAVWRRIVRGSE